MKIDKPLLLVVQEVRQLLRIDRPKIYQLIKEGVLDGLKIGADWKIKTESVEALIGPIPERFFEQEEEKKEEV